MQPELSVVRGHSFAAWAMALLLAGVGPAHSATVTWTGAGGDANWTTAGNWGGTAPVAGDDLVFPGGAAQLVNNNDFSAGTLFNSIIINGSSGGYDLKGNPIRLASGITVSTSAGTSYVEMAIQLTASQTFSSSTPYPDFLGFFSDIDLGNYSLTIAVSPGDLIQLWGVISGTGSLTSTGATGQVAIQGPPSTYSGPTTVTGNSGLFAMNLNTASVVTVTSGRLDVGHGSSVGPVTVNSGGTIICEGGSPGPQEGNVSSLALASGSVYWVDFDTLANYGRVKASGTVDLGGATLQPIWGFTSSLGDQFLILNKTSPGAITGTFVGLPEGSTFPSNGRTYRITYIGGDGNDVVITDVTGEESIPATGPGGALLFLALLGVAGVLLLRRQAC